MLAPSHHEACACKPMLPAFGAMCRWTIMECGRRFAWMQTTGEPDWQAPQATLCILKAGGSDVLLPCADGT